MAGRPWLGFCRSSWVPHAMVDRSGPKASRGLNVSGGFLHSWCLVTSPHGCLSLWQDTHTSYITSGFQRAHKQKLQGLLKFQGSASVPPKGWFRFGVGGGCSTRHHESQGHEVLVLPLTLATKYWRLAMSSTTHGSSFPTFWPLSASLSVLPELSPELSLQISKSYTYIITYNTRLFFATGSCCATQAVLDLLCSPGWP